MSLSHLFVIHLNAIRMFEVFWFFCLSARHILIPTLCSWGTFYLGCSIFLFHLVKSDNVTKHMRFFLHNSSFTCQHSHNKKEDKIATLSKPGMILSTIFYSIYIKMKLSWIDLWSIKGHFKHKITNAGLQI